MSGRRVRDGHVVGSGSAFSRVPMLGQVLDCGCVVRLVTAAKCKRCGRPVAGDSLIRMPMDSELRVGDEVAVMFGCSWCGAEGEGVSRIVA